MDGYMIPKLTTFTKVVSDCLPPDVPWTCISTFRVKKKHPRHTVTFPFSLVYLDIFLHSNNYDIYTGISAIYIRIFAWNNIEIYLHIYIHTYIHTCMHAYIHTYIHTYTYICIPYASKGHIWYGRYVLAYTGVLEAIPGCFPGIGEQFSRYRLSWNPCIGVHDFPV